MCDHYRDHLSALPRPPGIPYTSGSNSYEDQCVGRSARPQLDVYKIPLAAAAQVSSPDTWGPSFFPSSAVGVMLDGLAHYPALDASGLTVWDSCESSLCNAHRTKSRRSSSDKLSFNWTPDSFSSFLSSCAIAFPCSSESVMIDPTT